MLGLAGAQQSHAGMSLLEGALSTGVRGWNIGAAVEPQGSGRGCPWCFLIPGTQERAQRRSSLCTKCTEEHSGDTALGGGVDEQGWGRRRQPEYIWL